MTQAPLEESEQAPLGVHPKSTSHLPPRCTGGVTGLPSKGAALEPKWLWLSLSLSLSLYEVGIGRRQGQRPRPHLAREFAHLQLLAGEDNPI